MQLQRRETSFTEPEYFYRENFPDMIWSPANHCVMLNEIKQGRPQLVYPDRRCFKNQMNAAASVLGLSRDEEVRKYDDLTQNLQKGINYEKLKEPKIVFNHHCPRSLFSILHLLIENASHLER